MNKKLKLYLILTITGAMLAWWAALFFTNTREQQINYYWQVGMGVTALLFAVFGILTAAKWNWLKSGVGRGIFFISLGLFMWGLGQLGWSYYLFADPGVEAVPSHIPDYIYFSALPLWFYGILTLSKATGARYGIRKTSGKIIVGIIASIMALASYYILVVVARGGTDYFSQPFLNIFFDLGYSIGDAILLTIVIAIFALSWNMLGGRFKAPVITILTAFIFLFFADFSYSYLNGQGVYYNGDIADLFFFLTVSIFGLGVAMLDPGHVRKQKTAVKKVTETPAEPTKLAEQPVASEPAPLAETEVNTASTDQPVPENTDAKSAEAVAAVATQTTDSAEKEDVPTPVTNETTPEFLKVNPVAPYAHPHDNSQKTPEENQ